MNKKTVRDINVEGRRALVRVDFNVPLDKNSGAITDDRRIRESLPTLEYLIGQKAKVIVASALGRPEGRVAPELSLRPVAELPPGSVLMLENLRFHGGEEKNEPSFARKLASLADVFVLDGFGTAHRKHASTVGVTEYLPSVAGFLMEKELRYLGKAVAEPDRPYAVISGGAKISDKVPMLRQMLRVADRILIGGGMANTFLKAEGFETGKSLIEEDQVDAAREIMERAREANKQLMLPVDVVVGDRFAADARFRTVSVKDVAEDAMILDIGAKTCEVYGRVLSGCRQVVWNGPMGVIEFPQTAKGSHEIAQAVAALPNATTILGGGETALIVEQLGIAESFTHVSTGGGASLKMLAGEKLPAVEALMDRIEAPA